MCLRVWDQKHITQVLYASARCLVWHDREAPSLAAAAAYPMNWLAKHACCVSVLVSIFDTHLSVVTGIY